MRPKVYAVSLRMWAAAFNQAADRLEGTPVSLDNQPDTEKKGCQKSSPECSPRTYKSSSDE